MSVVYRHIRKDKNQPFYIGIGKLQRAYSEKERNDIWHKIVAKTDYEVEILFEDLSWDKAVQKEKEFIALYGRKNNNTGILSNMTDGGEGTLGVVYSKERKKNMSNKYSGAGNPRAKKVYCEYLNMEFDTIIECADALNISQPYLSRMIKEERTNKYKVAVI